MRISISETIFASGLKNGEIKVWNYNLDRIGHLFTLKSYATDVLSLEYLSNNYLASGYSNGKIIIWNLLTNQTHIELTHSGFVRTIILIDLTTFASASSKTFKLWSIENFTNILTKEHSISSDIMSLKYYSNRLFSISSDGILKSWINFIYEFETNIQCVVLSFELISNGNLACGCNNDMIKIYSVGLSSFSFIKSFQQNRDISSLVAIETQFLVSGDTDGILNIWDHITGSRNLSYRGHTTNIYTLEYIGNKIFLSGSEAGYIRAWNVFTGKKLTQINLGIPLRCLKYFDPVFKTTTTTSTGSSLTNSTRTTLTTSTSTTLTAMTSSTLTTSTSTTLTAMTSSTFTTSTSTTLTTSTNSTLTTSNSSTLTAITSSTLTTSTLRTKIFMIKGQNDNAFVNILSSRTDLTNFLSNCSNNGEYSYDVALDKFICACRENYYGSACKSDSRLCSSNPCLNKGNCSNININGSLNYKCQCFDGYSGRNCEFKKEICSPEICSNNGFCYYFNQNPKCKCFYLYGGDKCGIELDDLKIRKVVIRTSSIIALIIISILLGLFVINDILSCCCRRNLITKKKKNRRSFQNTRVKFVYLN